MKTNSFKLGLALTAIAALSLTGCGKKETVAEKAPEESTKKVARLVYPNWAESVAYTHVAKVVLEERMGYECEITMADVGPAYTAVANNNQDAFMESWPIAQKDYIEKVKEDIVDLGQVYKGTTLGLVVPAYVTIDKISELNAHKEKFNGVITGIDSGAGMMGTIANDIIPEYELELKLVPSSGPAMTAALSAAIEEEKWIVVAGWKPHWKFGRWDLKILEQDEDKVFWGISNIHIKGHKDIETNKPELANFLKKMFFTDAQLSDLMLQAEESDLEMIEFARGWVEENSEVIEAWLP